MKIRYDKETDSLTVQIAAGRVADSDEIRPGVIFDFDADGKVLGWEILRASHSLEDFASVTWEMEAASHAKAA